MRQGSLLNTPCEVWALPLLLLRYLRSWFDFKWTLLQIAVHLQQMRKIGPFRKSGKGFSAHPKWAERFLRTQKNFFASKNTMKAQQK
jgi:hypothetical protein